MEWCDVMLMMMSAAWIVASRTTPTKLALAIGAAVLVVLALRGGKREEGPPKVGDKAPDFTLPDQNGRIIRLSDFRGKKTVVLAFYIKAFTPG